MLGKDDSYNPNFTPDEFMRVLLTRVLHEFGDNIDYSDRSKYSKEALERMFDLRKEIDASQQGKFVLSQKNLLKILAGYIKQNRYIGPIGRTERKFLLLLCKGKQSTENLKRKLNQKQKASLRVMKYKLEKKIRDRDKRHITGINSTRLLNGKLGYELTFDAIKFRKILEKQPQIYQYLKYEHKITP